MTCRKSHSAKQAWGFATLPCELRHQILEDLRQQAGTEQRLSAWAQVAREWQRFFEPDIFESLSLQTPGPDIQQLETIVINGRQKFVRKVSLQVHLAQYSKKEKYEFEDEDTKRANIKAFSEAILNLFSVLSGWIDGTSAQGLTFELSASSPSYYLHRESVEYVPRNQYQAFLQRSLGTPLDIHFNSPSASIPPLPIITRFSMNQRSHRKLSPSAVAVLLASMPCLRDVNYQPVWTGSLLEPVERGSKFNSCDLAISTFFRSVYVSSSMQDVSLWEEPHQDWSIYQRKAPKSLVSVAVLASYRLRNFTMSNVVDAVQFFECHESMTQGLGGVSHAHWPNLVHLCLTTSRGKDNLNVSLARAARAACHMPKLKIMEVWCPEVWKFGLVSFLFCYEVSRTDTRLTVMANSTISLSEEILTAWLRVSDLHSQHKLDFRVDFMDIRYPGLKLIAAHHLPWLQKHLRSYNRLQNWGPATEQ